MERKQTCLRLPLDMIEELSSRKEGFNPSIIADYYDLQVIRRTADTEMKGTLSPNLWKSLYTTLTRQPIDLALRHSKTALLALCQEDENYRHTFSCNGCTVTELESALSGLNGIHIDAICRRVEKAKDTPDINLDEWVKW